MPIDPALSSLLNETTGSNTLEGVTGVGGTREWPKPGTHPCNIIGMDIRAGKFKHDKVDYDAISVQFKYLCINPDPTSGNPEPLEWTGAFFNLPKNETAIPGSSIKDKGVGFRIENDKQRLMSIAKCVLGPDAAMAHKSYGTLLPAVMARIEKDGVKAVSANINVDSRTDTKVSPPKTYLNEWGVNALAS